MAVDDQVIAEKKRAVILRPNDAVARVELGAALLEFGQTDTAAAQLEKAVELDAHSAQARQLLARAYIAEGRLTVAEEFLQPHADAEDPVACDALADVYLKMGRDDDALLYLDIAARLDPTRVERFRTACVLAGERGLLEKVEAYALAALAVAPDDRRFRDVLTDLAIQRGDLLGTTESPLSRGADFLLGRTLQVVLEWLRGASVEWLSSVAAALRKRDIVQAKRTLITAPKEHAASFEMTFLKGEIASAAGDRTLAEKAYRDASERLGAASRTSPTGDARKAIDSFRALALSRLAEHEAERGDWAGARRSWEESARLDEKTETIESVGDACVQLADLDAAKAAYKRASAKDAASSAGPKLAALRRRKKSVSAGGSPNAVASPGRIGALGWGGRGGLVSPVEAVAIAGSGELLFTGNVGEIGKEAATVAYSCVKARAPELGIASQVAKSDLHIHFADMAIAKDGPSAGLALALAAISALRQEELLPALAATGEITVHGAVRPVGGLHEKLIAACLAGIRIVILPRKNILNIRSLPREVRKRVAIHGVDSIAEAVDIAFQAPLSTSV